MIFWAHLLHHKHFGKDEKNCRIEELLQLFHLENDPSFSVILPG